MIILHNTGILKKTLKGLKNDGKSRRISTSSNICDVITCHIFINPKVEEETINAELKKSLNKMYIEKDSCFPILKIYLVYLGNHKELNIDKEENSLIRELLDDGGRGKKKSYRHVEDKKPLEFILRIKKILEEVKNLEKIHLLKSTSISKNMLSLGEKWKKSINQYLALPELENLIPEKREKDENQGPIDDCLTEYFKEKGKLYNREIKTLVLNGSNGYIFTAPATKDSMKMYLGMDDKDRKAITQHINKLTDIVKPKKEKKENPISVEEEEEEEVSMEETDESKVFDNLSSQRHQEDKPVISLSSLFAEPSTGIPSKEEPLGETSQKESMGIACHTDEPLGETSQKESMELSTPRDELFKETTFKKFK